MGAVGFTDASPVRSPTFFAPNSLTSWKNFSVTKAFRGAVYQAACFLFSGAFFENATGNVSDARLFFRDGG